MKKCIVVGVTSSIAIYKSVQLVSDLLKKDYDVEVIMSRNATKFISPMTFSSLTKHKTYVDTFDREVSYQVEHISVAKKADLFVIAPATANIIAKVAHGICDDMLSTTFLAAKCPKLIAPAMNTNMLENPIMQDNLEICRHYGYEIIDTDTGLLACGDNGKGKLAPIDVIIDRIECALTPKKLTNFKIMVSAGPTQEAIDPVRFITNHSSGKMGYAIARAARNMGADVTLISGPVELEPIEKVKMIYVISAAEMAEAVKSRYDQQDVIIMAAAVGDFSPTSYSQQKIKKQGNISTLELKQSEDILAYLGENRKPDQIIAGFAMESENLLGNAKEKLEKKHVDYIIANSINIPGSGFKGDTNIATIISKDDILELELMSKQQLAETILDNIIKGDD